MLGADPEPITLDNVLAIRAWNLLANGMGGLDWAGLPLVVELLGVQDVEALVDALLVIKTRPPPEDPERETADNDD